MPASSIFVDLFTTVDALLTGDVYLMSLITGVFQQAPDAQPFPYITMGNGQKAPWKDQVFGKWGDTSVLLILDIWTDLNDGDAAILILAECDRLLDGKTLSLAHYTNILFFNELSLEVPEENQQLRHMTARYRSWNSAN